MEDNAEREKKNTFHDEESAICKFTNDLTRQKKAEDEKQEKKRESIEARMIKQKIMKGLWEKVVMETDSQESEMDTKEITSKFL